MPQVRFTYWLAFIVILLGGIGFGQTEADELAKAKAALDAAIQARGGSAYLNIRTEIGTGQYNRFEKGISTIPVPFVDYIEYPDKERTEFGKKKDKFIQANIGATGWTFDGVNKAIKDQPEEQTKDFVENMRYNLDGLLRGSWRAPEVKVTYIPRKEAWRLQFGEAVKFEFPDGNTLTLYLDFQTHLPFALVREHTVNDQPVKEETRFFQWVSRRGVMAPNIIDFYRDGLQVSRINYETLVYNEVLPAGLFDKPSNPKDIK